MKQNYKSPPYIKMKYCDLSDAETCHSSKLQGLCLNSLFQFIRFTIVYYRFYIPIWYSVSIFCVSVRPVLDWTINHVREFLICETVCLLHTFIYSIFGPFIIFVTLHLCNMLYFSLPPQWFDSAFSK